MPGVSVGWVLPAPASRPLGEPKADRDCGRLDATGYAELREDVADVSAHGLLADEQPLADLAVRPATRDLHEHLAFAAAETEGIPAGGLPGHGGGHGAL